MNEYECSELEGRRFGGAQPDVDGGYRPRSGGDRIALTCIPSTDSSAYAAAMTAIQHATIVGALAWLACSAQASAQEAKIATAKPGTVRVLATAAIRAPLEAVVAQAEKAVGKPVLVEYGSARGALEPAILGGEEFEVALLLPDVDDELQQQGKIKPARFAIARVNVAIGVRGEAAGLDVSTPAALKQALLKARSVKYVPKGAARPTVKKVLSTLQIADAIHDSSQNDDVVPLGPGEYEIRFFPVSEILMYKSLTNLGPVIPELQVPVVIEAVVGAHAKDDKAARALIQFLQGPAIDPPLKESGMMKSKK